MEVRRFEPRNAVFAGPTGTEFIVELISQARTVVNPGGWLVMEISGTIAKRVEELLNDWEQIRVINDLQGIARVVAARKAF
jgi:release factor glutamine methyltransferase